MKVNMSNLHAVIHKRIDAKNNIFLKVSGNFTGKRLLYFASSPPDRRLSYSGSALPFPNEAFAYDGTTSKGLFEGGNIIENSFEFVIPYPNAHYIESTGILLKPYIRFVVDENIYDVVVGDQVIPNRSLTGLPHRPDRSTQGGFGSGGKN